jgi:hypothetical protein
MKIDELLEKIQKGSKYLGTYDLLELMSYASARGINGIAIAKGDGRNLYLALIAGEAEGAIYIDEKGALFGDKAVLMIQQKEKFVLTENTPDVVEELVMGSRIFDKNRLKKSISYNIPEIGGPSGGIGVLSITVKREGDPQNGVRVSIRKDGRILGSDITTNDGTVRFRIAFGVYDCIVQDKAQMVTKYRIEFDASHLSVPLSM